MKYYGSDKPDLRFGMKFVELMDIMKGHGFSVFDNAAYVGGICAEGAATYTRKQLDALTEFVKTSADWCERYGVCSCRSRRYA